MFKLLLNHIKGEDAKDKKLLTAGQDITSLELTEGRQKKG